MANSYNGNGRPVITIYGKATNFSLHAPDGVRGGLLKEDAANLLTQYPVKPVLEFGVDVSGGAKAFFRDKISKMPIQVS